MRLAWSWRAVYQFPTKYCSMTDLADGRDKGHVVLSLLIMNNKHAATIVHQFIHLQKKNPTQFPVLLVYAPVLNLFSLFRPWGPL